MAKRQTIGSLLVEIGVDLTDFEKKMNQFNREFGKIGTQVQDTASQIGMAFGGISLAIGAGLGFTVKKAAEFEQGLSNIKAVSGATAQEMEQLKNLALEMGADTKYSATEAALGIEELVKAGVSMDAIVNGGLKGALSLATAGGLELAEAAEIASTALNAFKAENLSVADAADILAGAANASATSVQELKFGLSMVSAVSSSVGMTFEDTSSALAVFANNGLKGSDAGTSLKTMLLNLQPSTKQAKALFEELGLTTAEGANQFFTAEGKLKSLNEIAKILQSSLSGLTDQQRLQTMKTLFGIDAIRAANILFKEGEEGVNNMKAAMSNVTAEQVAAEKMNNLNGAIEQLKGSFETLMISLGETLLPALKMIANFLSSIVDWFNQLSPTTKVVIVAIASLAFVLTGIIAIVALLTAGLGTLAAVQWAVVAPILATIGIVTLWIAGILAVVAAIAVLYHKNEAFAKFIDTIWSGIKAVIMAAVNALIPVVKSVWTTLKDNVMEVWSIVKPIFQAIWDLASAVFNGMSSNGDSALSSLSNSFKIYFGFIGTIVKVGLEIILGAIQIALTLIITIFKLAFESIKFIVRIVFNVMHTIIKTTMDIFVGIFKTVSALLRGDWQGAWDAIKSTVSNVLENIKTMLSNAKSIFADAGKGFITALVDGIKKSVSVVTDTIKDVAGKIRDFLPFSPAKVGPLSDIHKIDFANPISDSIRAGIPDVQASMNSMLQVPGVNADITNDVGGTTVIMQLDGKTIAKSTFAKMGGTFRLRGAVT